MLPNIYKDEYNQNAHCDSGSHKAAVHQNNVLYWCYGLTFDRCLIVPLHSRTLIVRTIAFKLSRQHCSSPTRTKMQFNYQSSGGPLWPLTFHLTDNPRPSCAATVKPGKGKFSIWKLSSAHGRKDKRVSRDFSRLVTRHHLSTSGGHVARKLHAVSRSGAGRGELLRALLQTTKW